MANALMVIHPKLENGMWVFDDAARDLKEEPFVKGIPEIIREVIGPEASEFTAVFSSKPFPVSTEVMTRGDAHYGGFWYRHDRTGKSGWLCPALFRYFPEAPDRIYLQIKVPA